MLPMKKLALAALTLATLATPLLACPGHDEAPKTAEKDQPVRTADKDKKATEPAKKTETPAKDQKAADAKAKPTTTDAKKPDKVSLK